MQRRITPSRRRPRRALTRLGTLATAAALALTGSTTALAAAPQTSPAASSTAPSDATTSAGPAVDLGALFVGAHPDDEAGALSTFGYWKEHGVRTGVVTVTRGEGGGNAIGPEEGPALGLIREAEERRAVGAAGITDIFNLDDVDFYYTVSQPLTRQTWGHDDVLGKIVRIIRTTRPETLVTMNPAPSPGQHGNHQEAARLTVEAYYAAADPKRFPEQIMHEGLRPFAPSRLLLRASWGSGTVGPSCPASFTSTDPTRTVFGSWSGELAPAGGTWAAVERAAQRQYASQGWAGFPDVSSDPNQLGCDYFTLVDSRAPVPAPGSPNAGTSLSALYGANLRAPGGLPLGTELRVRTDQYNVVAGAPFRAHVWVKAPAEGLSGTLRLGVPAGWTVSPASIDGTLRPGGDRLIDVTVTPPASVAPGTKARISATITSDQGTGYADHPVNVTGPVSVRQADLPQVAQYRAWTNTVQMQEFADIVQPVATVPVGGTKQVGYVVTNNSATAQTATVTPAVPAGFTVTSGSPVTVAAGASTTVQRRVTNADTALPTSMYGGTNGDYLHTVTATATSATGISQASATGALELVPSTVVPQASTAPKVDGVVTPGEYTGPVLDLSRRWEGEACATAADCSSTAQVSWSANTLYIAVTVTDDLKGTALAATDCKRHWRTDAVEVAIDPRGTSENTSTTFKAAVLPWTAEGGPCYLRDADNHQGDGPATAPGMVVASTVSSPYTGYVVEMAIPMALLPGAVDPAHMGLNILPYDSDTQDKTGQTRIGWSVFGGVQGDPYRWGVATLAGYTPPAGRPTTAPAPVMPTDALSSLDSPQSIEQAVRNNVALAGLPASPVSRAGWLVDAYATNGRTLVLTRGSANTNGTAHVFVRDADGISFADTVSIPAGTRTYRITLDRPLTVGATVLAGWDDGAGGTLSSMVDVR